MDGEEGGVLHHNEGGKEYAKSPVKGKGNDNWETIAPSRIVKEVGSLLKRDEWKEKQRLHRRRDDIERAHLLEG